VVYGWSSAPIPWPRCVRLEPPQRGRGLLVDEELARAVRHESALAVAHWWGVHLSTVLNWRKALGVTRTNNEGSHRLVLRNIEATLESRFGEDAAVVWSPEEIALVGTLPDAEVARRIGRSRAAVSKKREALGRPALTKTPAGARPLLWTATEDEAVRTLPPREAARRTGRTVHAVHSRRRKLGVAAKLARRTSS
jgi:hypothetical protein